MILNAYKIKILNAIFASNGPIHGYDIMKATGLPSGSVYPNLERFVEAGWIESEWDGKKRARRYYRFTDRGYEEARLALADLGILV